MKEINRLGLQVAAITAVVLAILFGLYWGGKTLLFREEAEEKTEQEAAREYAGDRQQDSDEDGVADMFEVVYYQTDPNNPDTDGDGMSDLDEIIAGRDPRIPGPDDAVKPATGSQVTQQKTFTQRYLATLPEDVPQEDILDQAKLEAFVEKNRGALMPALTEDDIKVAAGEGKEAVSAYLDQISSAHNDQLKEVTSSDVAAAFRAQVNARDKQPMNQVVKALSDNVGILKAVPAPAEVKDTHIKLVAASRSLRDNAELLSRVDQDFVGALVAARNIEDLGAVFQELAERIRALEEMYDIK